MIIFLEEEKRQPIRRSKKAKVEKKVTYKCPYVDVCEHVQKETCYSVTDRNNKTEVCFTERPNKRSIVNLNTGNPVNTGSRKSEIDNAVDKLLDSGRIAIFKL